MRVTIVGAGAVGGTLGAHLARAGHDVLLVDAARDHVDAIARGGLAIEGKEEFRVRVRATTPDGLAAALGGRDPGIVMLAVKAQDTSGALAVVVPFLGPDSYVVSMQNGLNERVIAARIGAGRTVGAFVNFGADYLAPSRILYGGGGALYLGELNGRSTSRVDQLADTLRQAFLANTSVTSNIWGYLWGKMGYASMLFATAVVDETIADVLADPANEALLAGLAGEAVRVADAEGTRCEPFDGYDPDAMRLTSPRNWPAIRRSLAALATFNRGSLKQKSGIWRDLAVRHRRTEVDFQLGVVIEVGRGNGLPLPLTERVVDIIHDLEARRRPMSPANLVELRALAATIYPDAQG